MLRGYAKCFKTLFYLDYTKVMMMLNAIVSIPVTSKKRVIGLNLIGWFFCEAIFFKSLSSCSNLESIQSEFRFCFRTQKPINNLLSAKITHSAANTQIIPKINNMLLAKITGFTKKAIKTATTTTPNVILFHMFFIITYHRRNPFLDSFFVLFLILYYTCKFPQSCYYPKALYFSHQLDKHLLRSSLN